MRYFALLNNDNLVINISVADDTWDNTGWIEYTNKKCGIGFTYNSDLDLFIAPQCHNEATFNLETNNWDCTNEEHSIETLAE